MNKILQLSRDLPPRRDGGGLTSKSYKFPFIDGDGRRDVAGTSLNITKEKQIEEQLRTQEGKADTTLSSRPRRDSTIVPRKPSVISTAVERPATLLKSPGSASRQAVSN